MSKQHIGYLSAWIEIDGKKAECYPVRPEEEFNEPDTVTCWIASEEGKNFSVNWEDHLRNYPTTGCVDIDGQSGGTKHMSSLAERPYGSGRCCRSSRTVSASSKRPYIFSRIRLVDSESAESLDENAHNIGEIKLTVWRTALSSSRMSVRRFRPYENTDKPVDERTKKASTHRVCYGDEVRLLHERPMLVRHHKRLERLATFVFKYTSREVLQAEGIMPQGATGTAHSRARRSHRLASKSHIQSPPGVKQEPEPYIHKDLGFLDLTQDDAVKEEALIPQMELVYDDSGAIDLTLD